MKKSVKIIAIIGVIIVLAGVLFAIFSEKIIGSSYEMKTENFEIDSDMLSYSIDEQCKIYADKYRNLYGEEYLTAIGLDTKKSLKDQESSYGGSWYDYFKKLAVEDLSRVLALCETAKAQGTELTADETKAIESAVPKTEYEEESIISLLKLKKTAEKYEEHFLNSLSYTNKDYEEYYNQNRNEFDCVDYKCIEIFAGAEFKADKAMAEAEKTAKEFEEKIKSVGFDAAAEEYIKRSGLETTVEDMTFKEYPFEDNTQFGVWAFDSSRKAGDTIIFKGTGQYAVYYIEKAPYKLDYTLREVQTFARALDSGGLMAEVYNSWCEKENTEENFYTLSDNAKMHNAIKSEMSKELIDWIYSDERKSGDFTMIEDESFITIVRYKGENGSYFETLADKLLRESDFNKMVEEKTKNQKIIFKK